jgi:hypothetical protein
MKNWRLLSAIAAVSAFLLTVAPSQANAQLNITIGIGAAPVCPYGYFNYAPYPCAPFGYYGPQWFTSGIFIGAGPWYRGPVGFRGYINHDFDPHFGYRGPLPVRGEHADWDRHRGWDRQFRGNEYHAEYRHDNGNHYGEYKNHDDHGHGNSHDNGHGNDHDNGHGNDHGHDNGHGHDHGDDHGHK